MSILCLFWFNNGTPHSSVSFHSAVDCATRHVLVERKKDTVWMYLAIQFLIDSKNVLTVCLCCRYCYTSFLDYHRCQKARGTDYEPCQYFKKVFTSMCPNAWVEKWNTQLEEGTFPGRI